MSGKTTTIPVKMNTKEIYDLARDGEKHDRFVVKLIRLWLAFTPVERAQRLSANKQQGPLAG